MRARSLGVLALALLSSCAAGDDVVASPDAAVDVADEPDVTVDVADAAALDDAAIDVADEPDALDAPEVFDARDEVAAEAAVDAPVDVETRPDAGPLGDSLPTGAIFFFSAASCPDGWVPFDDGAGRVAVPTTGGAAGGAVRGVPLRSGEDRTHTHHLSASFTLGDVSYVGVVGGANMGVGAAGAVSFSTTTEPASTGLPYVQLLVCRKTAAAVSGTRPLPAGMMMFFAGERCPAGFSQAPGTQGRLPVGLADGATQGATFGGAALGMTDAPSHAHAASVSVATGAHGIALASGCCGRGYARSDTYTAAATTVAAEADIPTIQLLQCVKE